MRVSLHSAPQQMGSCQVYLRRLGYLWPSFHRGNGDEAIASLCSYLFPPVIWGGDDLILAHLGVLSKEVVLEKKRPYYRYVLQQNRIVVEIDLMQVRREPTHNSLSLRIREKENAGARFAVARSDDYITSVAIWSGEGRERTERKIKLTTPQGKFLYHLPFPKAVPLTISDIMQKAGIDEILAPEILDLVQLLEKYDVIENLLEVPK